MRIAYLILAHQKPEQLARLVATLPRSSPIFIHIDAKVAADVMEKMRALLAERNVVFVKRHRCWWGAYGIVAGTIELIRAALDGKQAFDYATLLSGADYPIKPHDHIEQYLEARPGAEHIECFRIDLPNKWNKIEGKLKAPDRTMRYHFWWESHKIQLWWRSLPYGLLPYGGAQWWTLSSSALAYIDRYLADRPKVARFFQATYVPDEAIFHTILANSDEFASRITNDPLRLVDWDRPEPPFPAILSLDDMPFLKASHCHFARKFAAENVAVLTAIDEQLRSPAQLEIPSCGS